MNFADAPAIVRGNSRVASKDRFETAVAVSQRLFPNGKAPAVFLVSGSAFADGLAIGALASFQGGPPLLTTPATLPEAVAAEIQRLGSPTVDIA